jgi:hypothetical protein
MSQTIEKFSVYHAAVRLANGLREEDAKKFAEGELVKLVPSAAGKVTDWTPRGHLFYEDGEALVPSALCIRPDRDGAPTHVVPEHMFPLLSFSGSTDLEAVRFLMTSPSIPPRMMDLEGLIEYMRRIFWLTHEPGTEDDQIWALVPGYVEPFRTVIAETEEIEVAQGEQRRAKSKLVMHVPLDEADVQDGMQVMLVYRNGLRKVVTLHEIKHSALIVTVNGARETLHWTAIRHLYKRQILGDLEWELGEVRK